MTAVAQEGDEKEIIDLYIQNKLCWGGAWLRSKGFSVKCPGHIGCTSNTDRTQPLSEFEMGKHIGEHFALENILIEHVCTDGDARACDGVESALQISNPLWHVLRQSDTTHLGVSQYKKSLKCEFSRQFFPMYCETKESRNELQRVFSQDLKSRCHIVHNNLYEECNGNVHAMALKLSGLVTSIVNCYTGDHERCLRKGNLNGCHGGKTKNWFKKSVYLTTLTYNINSFNMSCHDKKLVKEVLRMKLGHECIPLLKLKLNTNVNESANRGLSVSLPKNVNFGRNVEGRAHSSIHRMNNRPGNSLHLKLEKVGAGVSKGSAIANVIKQILWTCTKRACLTHYQK